MKSRLIVIIFLLSVLFSLNAQSTPQISGLNEMQFIYRTAPDSLNAYFRDSFGFNLDYRNFTFGMKFIAELPKYSVNQDELIDELWPYLLSAGWKELYVKYEQDSFSILAGNMSETFGSGMNFRAWEDIEFDEDNRLTGFSLKYDNKIKLKSLYGAIPSTNDHSILEDPMLDLAYGLDALYPVLDLLSLGGTAMAMRTSADDGRYNQRDIFGGRLLFNLDPVEVNAEYSGSKLYKRENGLPAQNGSAIYSTANVNLYPFTIGAAYKRYDQFSYRLQDLPMANYHNEPLEDLNPGLSEEGLQGMLTWSAADNLSFNLDYAEAWNLEQTKHMNDLYAAVDYTIGSSFIGAEFSHLEKQNEENDTWQKELTPALHIAFPFVGRTLSLKAQHKYLAKEKLETVDGVYGPVITDHWEPRLQADIAFGKLALSASAQSNWEDMGAVMDSQYWTNLEAKYSAFTHTDLTLFVGREAGGKVCRNGICRYVAPFQGIKFEVATRF